MSRSLSNIRQRQTNSCVVRAPHQSGPRHINVMVFYVLQLPYIATYLIVKESSAVYYLINLSQVFYFPLQCGNDSVGKFPQLSDIFN